MRIVRYSDAAPRYGVLEGGRIHPLEGQVGRFRRPRKSGPLRVADVPLLAPMAPSKIVAVAMNYRSLIRDTGTKSPAEPLLFLKPSSAVIGPDAAIVYPRQSHELLYEGELALVISRTARDIPQSKADDVILGYTCLNDVTAADLQARDQLMTRSKSFDTFAPIGPWVETEVRNCDALNLTTRVNGEVRQLANTSDMIFSCSHLVSFISSIMTLYPGDVISTGSPGGVGEMKPGDIVEVEIEKIGCLRNTVTAA
jgi:2-keto-4-pentenoate hydratase/2-oxohepta-3-ene-1,7-dioic acid hydratase in catechol pathway